MGGECNKHNKDVKYAHHFGTKAWGGKSYLVGAMTEKYLNVSYRNKVWLCVLDSSGLAQSQEQIFWSS